MTGRLAIIALCDNDAERVETFVSHYAKLADALLVVDRGSTDGSRERVVEMQRGGLPIVVFDTPPSQVPDAHLDSMFENAFRMFHADRVLALEVGDELRYHDRDELERATRTRDECRGSSAPPSERTPGRAGPGVSCRPSAPPAPNGAFSADFHSENLYLDLPPFRHIADRFAPGSVLDLGCGLGGYVRAFSEWGADRVLGVEGFERPADFLAGRSFRRHDLTTELRLPETYDLVICAEVIEHIEPSCSDVLIDSITHHAGELIAFSAARPRQPGIGHINCRPIDAWVESFAARGWHPLVFDTLAARSLATFHWFRRNLLLLAREPEQLPGFRTDDLDSYEARYVPWRGQAPAVHHYPLEEPPAPLPETDPASLP